MDSLDTRTLADFVNPDEPDLLNKAGPFADYIQGLKSRGEYSFHRRDIVHAEVG